MSSKAQIQYNKRMAHIINSDNEIEIPTEADIANFFELADNTSSLENIGNRKEKNTYFKRNEINNFYDAQNWFTLQEVNDFLADY